MHGMLLIYHTFSSTPINSLHCPQIFYRLVRVKKTIPEVSASASGPSVVLPAHLPATEIRLFLIASSTDKNRFNPSRVSLTALVFIEASCLIPVNPSRGGYFDAYSLPVADALKRDPTHAKSLGKTKFNSNNFA